jgi:hypothetical protein
MHQIYYKHGEKVIAQRAQPLGESILAKLRE